MRVIIVLYLLYFGIVDGKYIKQKCLPKGSDCLNDDHCCSKNCFTSLDTTNHQCADKIEQIVQTYTICVINNQDCDEDEDCCSLNCSKVSGNNHRTCRPKLTMSTIKKKNCSQRGHYCLSDDDCCSEICRTIIPSFFSMTFNACNS